MFCSILECFLVFVSGLVRFSVFLSVLECFLSVLSGLC